MIHKVAAPDLQPGMYIVDLNLSPQEFPRVYAQEGLLASAPQIADILQRGYREAFVDDEKSSVPITVREDWTLLAGGGEDEAAADASLPEPHTMRNNLERAVNLYSAAVQSVEQLFDFLARGRSMPVETINEVASAIVEHIVRDKLTLATVTKLRVHGNYTFAHCVNVAVLAVLFGRHLKLNADKLQILALAGLVHDIGKAAIPNTLLDTARPLTDQEFALMKNHVLAGYEALSKADDIGDEVRRAVLEHHERYDGTGYPFGRKGNEISLPGRILAVIDVYDALTSKKPYKPALLPYTAVSFLYGRREQSFDPTVVERFIQCMGVYPVGSVVRLDNGETGVVYLANPQKPLLPIVSVVLDAEGTKRPLKMVDLGRDGAPRIAACLDPVRSGINCAEAIKSCAWAQRRFPTAALYSAGSPS